MSKANARTLQELADDLYIGYSVHKLSIETLAHAVKLDVETVRTILNIESLKHNGTFAQHTTTMRGNDQSDHNAA